MHSEPDVLSVSGFNGVATLRDRISRNNNNSSNDGGNDSSVNGNNNLIITYKLKMCLDMMI